MNFTEKIKDPLNTFRILQIIIAILCITIPAVLRNFDKDEYYPQRAVLMDSAHLKNYLLPTEMDSINRLFKDTLGDQIKLEYCDSTIELNGLGQIPKDNLGFRSSISDYAYSSNSYLFGLLYMMAAMLYIYNGVIYSNRKDALDIQRWGSWWNVGIGLCLIGVVLNPQSANEFRHNFFSILFFAGNVCVMLFVPKQTEKKGFTIARITMGSLCVLIFLGLLKDYYSLLWAEWVSLTIIAIYLILMSIAVHRTGR